MRTLGMMLAESFANDKQMKDAIYKILKPYFNKRWKDEDWSTVNDLVNTLKKSGFTVEVSVPRGGYRSNGGSQWKEYHLTISKDMRTLHGILSCAAAGTTNDPFKEYDMTLTF